MEQRPTDEIPHLVKQSYGIVRKLEKQFPGRLFTLDGHLVGSIGEVLAAHRYGLELLPASTEVHDAKTKDGKLIQIKATQRDRIGLRSCPEHLLVLCISPEGRDNEVYNGPGELAWSRAGRMQGNGQCRISTSRLKDLMKRVSESERLPMKNPPEVPAC